MRKNRNFMMLVLLNAALLLPAFGVRAQPQDFHRQHLDLTKPPYFQQLNLTEDQRAQIQKVYDANKAAFETDRAVLHDARAKFEQAMEGDTDDGALRKQHQAFVAARDEMANLGFEQALAIRKILTPEQRKKFGEIRKTMFEKMHGNSADR